MSIIEDVKAALPGQEWEIEQGLKAMEERRHATQVVLSQADLDAKLENNKALVAMRWEALVCPKETPAATLARFLDGYMSESEQDDRAFRTVFGEQRVVMTGEEIERCFDLTDLEHGRLVALREDFTKRAAAVAPWVRVEVMAFECHFIGKKKTKYVTIKGISDGFEFCGDYDITE